MKQRPTKLCEFCHEPFMARRSQQKYCCQSHQWKAWESKHPRVKVEQKEEKA